MLLGIVLWEETDLIRTFVADNPAALSPDLLELVASWQHRRPGKYVVWKHYKRHTLLMEGPGRGFGVLGLYSTWDEILPQAPPVMVKAGSPSLRGSHHPRRPGGRSQRLPRPRNPTRLPGDGP